MRACEARLVRVSWTAPSAPVGPVWFNVVAVVADGSADPTGDAVRRYARLVERRGDGAADTARVGPACSAGGAPDGGWLLLSVALLLRRRKRA
jgi:MYXO-CTERM domain-containing protein